MLAAALPGRSLVEMSQPLSMQLRCFNRETAINHNRASDCLKFELIADSNATSLCERLRQRNLKLPSYFAHRFRIAYVKDIVKDRTLMGPRA